MRESQTAVLERGIRVEDEFATEPFEVAWAGEARWFVQFLEPGEDATVTLTPQVSADGLAWVDHEAPAVEVAAGGLITLRCATSATGCGWSSGAPAGAPLRWRGSTSPSRSERRPGTGPGTRPRERRDPAEGAAGSGNRPRRRWIE